MFEDVTDAELEEEKRRDGEIIVDTKFYDGNMYFAEIVGAYDD
jgi:hypothetical protein